MTDGDFKKWKCHFLTQVRGKLILEKSNKTWETQLLNCSEYNLMVNMCIYNVIS